MESGELEAQVRAMIEEGRAAWPALRMAPDVFAAYVRERMTADEDRSALGVFHGSDLYLACACAHGVTGAVEALDKAYLADIARALHRLDGSAAFADEVRQIVRDKLFVAEGGERPKIVNYSGRYPLATWIRTAARWTGKDLLRRESVQARVGAAALSEVIPVGADPELDYLKACYRTEFREAFEAAVASLTVQERLILRLWLVKGLSHEEIARIYGVSQPTITRRIGKAREAITEGIQRSLRERLRLGASEVQSLARLVLSQLDLSLARWLVDEATPRQPV